MTDKPRILALLREEFNLWEELLASLSEKQITEPRLPANLSIKDVIAHLRAWQQISIARLEAARLGQEPDYPGWLIGPDLELDLEVDDVDPINARIYETYHHLPWLRVHLDWRDGYLRFLNLGESLSEDDLMNKAKYPWLHGYALIDVLQGSYEHHHIEHYEPLQAWLREHGLETGY
jgi:hypothetical protein